MHCCHHGKIDPSELQVKFDEEPTKLEDGTYEVPLDAVTTIGERTVTNWVGVIGMHVCAAVCATAASGMLMGALVAKLLKR